MVIGPLSDSVLLGDVDFNGVANFWGIQPLIAVASANDFQAEAGCDENAVVSFLDISSLVAILSKS